jgi:hypothetical protein
MTLVAQRVVPRANYKRKPDQKAQSDQRREAKKPQGIQRRYATTIGKSEASEGPSVVIKREDGRMIVSISFAAPDIETGRIASKLRLSSVKLKKSVTGVVASLLNPGRPPYSLDELANKLEAVAPSSDTSNVARTKLAQATIGVTSSKVLYVELERRAHKQGATLADVARKAFEAGFKMLDDDLWVEDSSVVTQSFQASYDVFAAGDKKQWSLRLARNTYARVVVTARERGVSQSLLACWCIARAIS